MTFSTDPTGPSSSLIHWLKQAPFELVDNKQYQDLTKLCAIFDQATLASSHGLAMGLEVHHDESKQVDLSIYLNGKSNLAENFQIPKRLGRWLAQVQERQLDSAFPQDYWLEFDSNTTGYLLMGLFQKCNPSALSSTLLVELLDYTEQESGFLKKTIEDFGSPEWLGLIERSQEYIKLVIPLRKEILGSTLLDFCSTWFHKQLNSAKITPNCIIQALDHWLETGRAKLSIDWNLSQDLPGNRLCFEIFSATGTNGENDRINQLTGFLHSTLTPTEQVRKLENLHRHLPYGSRRTSFNLIEEEILILRPNHIKICIDQNGIKAKDYLLLSLIHP